ncbi:hypothetical protein ID866_8975 [Astraeus odoratus]|nr:hypothetical protein ID866_8975 [Astraeus odoratus]
MTTDIHSRLLRAEQDFLSAFEQGEESLTCYDTSWASLLKEVEQVREDRGDDDHVVTLANCVAFRITALAKSFLFIHEEQEKLKSEISSNFEDILDGASLANTSPPRTTSRSTSSPSPSSIASAYRWLLDNLANPYPSSQVKAEIARASGYSENSINSWFISARRRMGWTSICRDYFDNRRADAIDAAHRALVKADPARELAPSIIQAFVTMKVTAEELYSATSQSSALAGELDGIIMDMKEGGGSEIGHNHRIEENLQREASCGVRQRRRTPALSSGSQSSPVPALDDSFTDESDSEDEEVLPPLLAGQKRRAPSLDNVQDEICTAVRPKKRLRSIPSSSTSNSGGTSSDGIPSSVPSRKRRLSAVDTAKRPSSLAPCPRQQAVSDPLPKATATEMSVDDWLNTSFPDLFDIPPPVQTVDLDHCVPWEVELFDGYSALSQNLFKEAHSCLDTSSIQVSETCDALGSMCDYFSKQSASVGPDVSSYYPPMDGIFHTDDLIGNMDLGLSGPDGSIIVPPDWFPIGKYDAPQQSALFDSLSGIDVSALQLPLPVLS